MEHIDILVIDDEIKFADMLVRRITLRGCTADVCYDGSSAIDWVRSKQEYVGLILLDLQLPDMYGTQVLAEIKKINSQIPVIILTGHGGERDKKECEALGAYRFMRKPLDIEDLMSIKEELEGVQK